MISPLQVLKDFDAKQKKGFKSLAVLLDPDNIEVDGISSYLKKLPKETECLFVGGSHVEDNKTHKIVKALKEKTVLPVVLFPGNVNQISPAADAILFLSLMSGENPEYLIRQQIKSVPFLKDIDLEIIPTGYILIDGGQTCTTEKVTKTQAIPQSQVQRIVHIALAAQYSGKRLIYLEAGSGARKPVNSIIISQVKAAVDIPVIVGGGIRTSLQRQAAYDAGADIVVMGTVFEN